MCGAGPGGGSKGPERRWNGRPKASSASTQFCGRPEGQVEATSWLWPSGMTRHCKFLTSLAFLAGMPTRCPGPGPSVPCAPHPVRFPGRGQSGGHFEPRLGLAWCLGLPALTSPPGGIRLGSPEFRRPVGPGRKCKAGRLAATRAWGAFLSLAGFSSPFSGFCYRLVIDSVAWSLPRPVPWEKLVPDLSLPSFGILRPGASRCQF